MASSARNLMATADRILQNRPSSFLGIEYPRSDAPDLFGMQDVRDWATKAASGGYARENLERLRSAFFGGGSGPERISSVLGEVMPGADAGAGLLGMLAGRRARTANPEALQSAERLKAEGKSDEEIWRQTAEQFDQPWWLGHPDRQPRFEISDEMALGSPRLKGIQGSEIPSSYGIAAIGSDPNKAVMMHRELSEAYPDLENIKVSGRIRSDIDDMLYGKPRAKGGYSPQTGVVVDAQPEEIPNVLLHELQHAVQRGEGMQRGGNLKLFETEGVSDPIRQYARLGGEMDARAVQKRQDLTQAQRAARPFWLDYDIPMEEMIIR